MCNLKKAGFTAGLFWCLPEQRPGPACYLGTMKYTIELHNEQQYQQLSQLAQALGMNTAAAAVSMSEQEQ
jgi:hypothetical protein